MANAPNFGTLLDTPSQSVERPKPLPTGSYLCVVKGQPRQDKSSKKGTEFVEFTLQPISALDDVDQEELTAMGGFADKTIKATYYLTENSIWRLKDFLDHCGIADEGTLRQRIDETPNCQVLAVLKHEASDDGQSIFARLARTAPASE